MTAHQDDRAEREALIRQHHQPGDTPAAVAQKTGIGKPELVRHDMIRLGLWRPRRRRNALPKGHIYQRKTVLRMVAAEIVMAVLQAEELLDVLAVKVPHIDDAQISARWLAARSQISHAKRIATQHGVLVPPQVVGA